MRLRGNSALRALFSLALILSTHPSRSVSASIVPFNGDVGFGVAKGGHGQ